MTWCAAVFAYKIMQRTGKTVRLLRLLPPIRGFSRLIIIQVSVLTTTETQVVEIIVMRVEVSLSVAWKKRAQTIVS